jgi:hypothetical protein
MEKIGRQTHQVYYYLTKLIIRKDTYVLHNEIKEMIKDYIPLCKEVAELETKAGSLEKEVGESLARLRDREAVSKDCVRVLQNLHFEPNTPSAELTTQLGQQLMHAQQMKAETDLKAANKRLSEVETDLRSEKEEGERKGKASEALVGRLLEEQKAMNEQIEQLSNKTKEGAANSK